MQTHSSPPEEPGMKSMFNQSDVNELLQRIDTIRPDSKPEWGRMNAAQMLAHSVTPLKVAVGDLKLERSLVGRLFGKMAKKKLTGGKPFGRNLPTDKHFVFTDQRNFDEEKSALVSLIRRFAESGPDGITKEPHPFFGDMTPREWDALTWNHLDHHLRQFGA